MGFLDKLRGQTATSVEAPFLDKALGDEEARRLRSELEQDRWQEAFQVVDRARDWDDREFLSWTLTDFPGRPRWIDEMVKTNSNSATAHLLRAAHSLKWAWEARGSGKAESVQDKGWDLFHQRLQDAEADLNRTAELDPADPTPWAYLLISALGLEKGAQHASAILAEARKRDRWHHVALANFQMLCTKKWGGSHELMFDVARQTAREAPEGNGCHTLIAEAHIERWLYMVHWDKDIQAARDYFERKEVAGEIRQAAERYLWSPKLKKTRRLYVDRGIFTFCFADMLDWNAARDQFEAMGPAIPEYPWVLAGDPVAHFTRVRERALKG